MDWESYYETINCPKCGKSIRIPKGYDKFVNCLNCGERVDIKKVKRGKK